MRVNNSPLSFVFNLIDAVVAGLLSYPIFLFVVGLEWVLPEFAALTVASIVFAIKEGPQGVAEFSEYASQLLKPQIEVLKRDGYSYQIATKVIRRVKDEVKEDLKEILFDDDSIATAIKEIVGSGFTFTLIRVGLKIVARSKTAKKLQIEAIKQFDNVVERFVKPLVQKPENKKNSFLTIERNDARAELNLLKKKALDEAMYAENGRLQAQIRKKSKEIEQKLDALLFEGRAGEVDMFIIKSKEWYESAYLQAKGVDDYPLEFRISQEQVIEPTSERQESVYQYARSRGASAD